MANYYCILPILELIKSCVYSVAYIQYIFFLCVTVTTLLPLLRKYSNLQRHRVCNVHVTI